MSRCFLGYLTFFLVFICQCTVPSADNICNVNLLQTSFTPSQATVSEEANLCYTWLLNIPKHVLSRLQLQPHGPSWFTLVTLVTMVALVVLSFGHCFYVVKAESLSSTSTYYTSTSPCLCASPAVRTDVFNAADYLLQAARECPLRHAVQGPESIWTFRELAGASELLRHALRKALRQLQLPIFNRDNAQSGCLSHSKREDEHIILIALGPCPESIAAIHAVLMEHCAYSCFDILDPVEKLRSWCEIMQPPVLITTMDICRLRLGSLDSSSHGLGSCNWDLGMYPSLLLKADEVLAGNILACVELPPLVGCEEDLERLAYVICTSGSTGRPSPVMVEHRSLLSFVPAQADITNMTESDRLALIPSLAYDPSVGDIFMSIFSRATLVLISDFLKRSGPDVVPWLGDHGITCFTCTPSWLRSVVIDNADVSTAALPALRFILCGGEQLHPDVVDTWSRGRTFFNIYGPTEATIACAIIPVEPGDSITIGHDFAGNQNLILDPVTFQQLPGGHHGVLFIAGNGLARGYLGDREKTSDRFPDVPGVGRLYNTGDSASRDDQGRLCCHGRLDWQVKVRGLRVELEALEAACLAVPGIQMCEARTFDNSSKLAVLFSGSGDTGITGAIQKAAASLGNAYQVHLVQHIEHKEWKYTTSRKLKRGVVPLQLGDKASTVGWDLFDIADCSELELELAQCICTLALGTVQKTWSKKSNFLVELGIDSSKVGKLLAALKRAMPHHCPTISTIYRAPTVEGLCQAMEADQASSAEPARPSRTIIFDKLSSANASSSTSTTHGSQGSHDVLLAMGSIKGHGDELYALEGWPRLFSFLSGCFFIGELLFTASYGVLFSRVLLPLLTSLDVPRAVVIYLASVLVAEVLVPTLLLVLAKWIVLGKYKVGVYPIYGFVHMKHWLVDALSRRTILHMDGQMPVTGSNFLLGYNFLRILLLRSLGSDVAWSALVTNDVRGFDLICVGPLASVHSYLSAINFVDKRMIIGTQAIGAGAHIACCSSVEPDAVVLSGAQVDPLTAVRSGEVVSGHWSGIPARQVTFQQGPGRYSQSDHAAESDLIWRSAMYALVHIFLAALCYCPVVPVLRIIFALLMNMRSHDQNDFQTVVEFFPVIYMLLTILQFVAVLGCPVAMCAVLPQVQVPFKEPLWTVRSQLIAAKVLWCSRASLALGECPAQKLFYRLCGAKIDPEVVHLVEQVAIPELLEVGGGVVAGCFNVLHSATADQGSLSIPSKTYLSQNVLVGNFNVIPHGVPDGVMVGRCTYVSKAVLDEVSLEAKDHPPGPADQLGLFGSPAMRFRRQRQRPLIISGLHKYFSEMCANMASPSIDCLNSLSFSVALVTGRYVTPFLWSAGSILTALAVELLIFVAFSIAGWFFLNVLLQRFLRWVVCSFMDERFNLHHIGVTMHAAAINIRFRVPPPGSVAGTPWMGPMLRILGADVGHNFFSPDFAAATRLQDLDYTHIGNNVTLDYGVEVVGHTVEDSIFSHQHLVIGNRSSLDHLSVHAGGRLGEGSHLRPRSITWKGRQYESNRTFDGAPAELVKDMGR